MRVIDARTGIVEIERAECLELLASVDLGRIAVVEAGHPVIFPVTYALDGELIVFRAAEGTRLDTTMHGGPVAFEIDEPIGSSGTGWSVVVTGWARLAATPAQADRFEALGLRSWSPDQKEHWFAVHPERITGRRIVALSGGSSG
jgi:nitroimidazol reductase NimA-like FMN-containing flavoprotein (pyridoxamine 5'-phosphate oxidase superfamily)